MKKIFAFFISLVMIFQVVAPVCSAKGYEIEMICVHNGLESKGFSVIEKDGELYAPTDELNWIFQKHVNSKGQKRFFLQENDVNLVFNLGEKNVLFSKTGKTIQVEPVSYTQEYSGTLVHEGIYYYPLSEILPWMNVECSVDNGILVIKPDMKSVWEISKEIKGDGLQFNIVDEMGQDTATVAALVTANVIDGFMAVFKGEFDRLIIIDENGDSWHTVNNYYDCLTEMATDDFMLSSQAEDILKSIKTVNKFDESLRELYEGTNTDEDLESFLSGYDFDKTVGADYGELCKQFETASDMADLAQAAGKVLPVLKAVEATSHILPGYFDALLSQQSNEGNTKAYQMALDRSVDALSGNRSTIYTALTDFVADMWFDDAGSVLEKGLSSAEFLSGFGGAVGAVDAALTLIWPVNKAAEDVAKLSVYYNIQRSAYDTANSYKALATSENNTHLIRVNYMLSLLASKKSYEAMQKVLGLIGQGELKQGDLDKINLMLVELAYAESAEENDTACDKSGISSRIKEIFEDLKLMSELNSLDELIGVYVLEGVNEESEIPSVITNSAPVNPILCLPEILLESEDAENVNKQIENLFLEEKENWEGYSETSANISSIYYNASVYENILSVTIRTFYMANGSNSTKVFNFDIITGKQLSDTELLSELNISASDVTKNLCIAAKKYFKEIYNYDSFLQAGMGDLYNNQLNEAESEYVINNFQLMINDNKLYADIPIPSMGGPDYINAIIEIADISA